MRTQDTDKLRACPVCATKLPEGELGLRDYSWLADSLPGRVGAADLDFVLEQSKTGRVLIAEFKPARAQLPTGQRLLLKRFVRLGCDVWVVWHNPGEPKLEVGAMDKQGQVTFVQEMTVEKFTVKVGAWWRAGYEKDA